mgnify:CR=1 FL=1
MAKLKTWPDGECEGCPVPELFCSMCKRRKKKPRERKPFGGECILCKPHKEDDLKWPERQ